jgi:uncharacterized surface protein with fasciclin (FAS1) repeats
MSCGNSSEQNETQSAAVENTESTERQGQAFLKDDEGKPNALQIALGSKDHTTLVAAVQAAQLENALVNAGPLTVFAPVNAAFEEIPQETLNDLLKPENKAALSNILTYHVTPGNLSKDFLKRFKKLGQANNQNVMVEVVDGEPVIGGAKILASIPAGNGIVHVIDKVLLPPAEE